MNTNEKIAAISTPAALADTLESRPIVGNYVKVTIRQREKAVEFLRATAELNDRVRALEAVADAARGVIRAEGAISGRASMRVLSRRLAAVAT